MIGGMIVTHGEFAPGIKHAVEMIVGKQDKFTAIALKAGDGFDQLLQRMQEELTNMNVKDCLLFVDLFGATPCNAASVLCSLTGCSVIAGVNLPILLEFITKREVCGKEVLIEKLKQCSKEDFRVIQQSDLL